MVTIGQRFARLLGVIEEALDARVIRVGKDGEPIDLGPDHYVRLTAADRFIKLLTAGRPPTVVSVIAAAAAIARWVLANVGTARAAAPGLGGSGNVSLVAEPTGPVSRKPVSRPKSGGQTPRTCK